MGEPAKKLSKVSKPFCDPVLKFNDPSRANQMVCILGLLKESTGGQKAGFEPVPNRLGYTEEELSPVKPNEEKKDQFKPNPPKNLTELITGKAEYSCKTKMPYTEEETVTRDISLPAIPEETEQAGRVRLEKAARDLTKTINGCFDVRFVRFLPTADEALKATPAKPAKTSSKEMPGPCAPGGKWEHRPICSK